uniref:MAK10-like protein n=1 Tax=Tanacetum cinerariifolium TaxID=118510 RepID=A0A699H0B3_TANCI|nr:MAK10-like protein [Tanacetum cinerariifolium]
MKPLDTFLMGDKVISTILEKENDEFIKFSVDDLVPILRESELTLDSTNLECSMPIDPPLPCTDVLGDAIVDIDLLLGEHLDTLSTGDREIDFNPVRDIEELECLLADDHVPVPKNPSDREDLCAYFQSSSHAVSDHLHVYILGILIPDRVLRTPDVSVFKKVKEITEVEIRLLALSETKILSVLLEITPDLATRAIETPLTSPMRTMWCLYDPTPSGGKWFTFKPKQNNLSDIYNPSWKIHPNLKGSQPQNSQNNFSNPPNCFQPNGSFLNRSFNNNPQNFNNRSTLEGLVSSFMASQDTRLSKFETDFKQQQGEMTNKIDIVLKAINDRMMRALPSDTVKNSKLNVNTTFPILSARSYPTQDPKYSSHIHYAINAITMCSKQVNKSHNDQPRVKTQTVNEDGTPPHKGIKRPSKLLSLYKDDKPGEKGVINLGTKDDDRDTIVKYKEECKESEEKGKEEKDDPENINANPPSPPDPSISFITGMVRKLNSFLDSLNLVPPSFNTEFVCIKENDGDIMFIKIIKKYDDPCKEEL